MKILVIGENINEICLKEIAKIFIIVINNENIKFKV